MVATQIILQVDENRWLPFFAKLTKDLRNHEYSEDNEYACYKVKDGVVYGYNGVYAMTNKANKAYQIIIVSPDQFGITLIDTKELSKTMRRLIQQIEIFLSALHRVIIGVTSSGKIPTREFDEHTLDDIREQIIIDNSL